MLITRLFSLRTLILALGMVALLMLSACAQYGIAEVVTTTSTGKTLSDHAVSFGSGKDCSTTRYQNGLTYCKEDEKDLKQTGLYCYPTLGAATCYDRPNPHDYKALENNRNDHNYGQIPPPQRTLVIEPEPRSGSGDSGYGRP
ncbi:MAG: hypothetical protein WD407_04925 [Rhodospirillales bacterium]